MKYEAATLRTVGNAKDLVRALLTTCISDDDLGNQPCGWVAGLDE